ncbi:MULTISPECIES: ThiF family adenylyltransferase [unclassified Staphylococcus]|uniref:ThiF family adenylyltransferase n=1 Tax=unclassified Staphylococcus TaxID=91994 RepID=UPI0021D2DDE6|nr:MULTISPECIES: ThiF family adenylyltransferase [unclassified Staphylococcus]UXR69287.1 ThiF family adenylyltransferase [Staphylococcus sp. IVB6246]UXR71339.1 ThiF family adenylyltransferase [Staphylococcus sp. IVB6240]UXR73616.1 ThiF family adenylyltransferase [Staphylococcus sp. IVB6238]UXR75932.1 ThiF family adenylyltransferase [Staphylococcus sp. IVB6233]UXR80129.1 ThiF family adenylyltransferase [Staphylococcus sp. IVB6218]
MTHNRYSRQILFDGIGQDGQEKINHKSVLIIGMGALGTHLAEGLVRAGIGKLHIVDRDYIEYSNLQRQTLFTEDDARQQMPKVIAAKNALQAIREDVEIVTYIDHVDGVFLNDLVPQVDLVLDATDNFETRMMVNDVAFACQKPWIYGGVVRSTYVEAPFIPGQTPCFQCLVPQIPAMNLTCDTVGVIQPAVTMTTSLQLRDALKILTETPIEPKLTYGDIWDGSHYVFGFGRMQRQTCTTCGEHPEYPYLNHSVTQYAAMCGRDTVQYQHEGLTYEQLVEYLTTRHISFHSNGYLLQFEYDGYRIVAFQNGRLLIHGMKEVKQAKKLIHQLFG